jgi:predicted RNase H-like nuclease (RuvC/YqgF family)
MELGIIMLRLLWISLGALLLAMPAVAQTTKSNPDLFLQCADYDNAYREVRNRMDSEKSQASYMNDQKDDLEDRIDDHEREINRLDEILKIMRSSDDVKYKRDREYRLYSRAFDEYDDFMIGFKQSRQNYQRMIDRSENLRGKLNDHCFGTWSRTVLDQYCGQGSNRMQAFCSRFDS